MIPIEKLKNDTQKLRKEVRSRTLGYIVGALGLIVGLAWNDAIKAFIEYWFPLGGNGIIAKFFYAAFITLIVIIVSYYLIDDKTRDESS